MNEERRKAERIGELRAEQSEVQEFRSVPDDVAESVELGNGVVVFELWNMEGEGPSEEQRQERDACRRQREAADAAAAEAADAADGDGETYICPWPGCDQLYKSKRVRDATLKGLGRWSNSMWAQEELP